MHKIRVLVVDDAVVMRRLLTEVVERDPRLEVAGTAAHGRIALQKLPQVNPDVVTLDLDMPELDGLGTLKELRRSYPRLPVIMLSAQTRRGAIATLDALGAGADDYVAKPSGALDVEDAAGRLATELLPKIHALCHRSSAPACLAPAVHPRATSAAADLVCIASSTGGPNALMRLFRDLAEPMRACVAIVQHMPPTFTASLAERLNSLSPYLRCREAHEGMLLEPGVACVAPGGLHLELSQDGAGGLRAHLSDAPPENSCRPAADVLFRSVAALRRPAVALVLTGMGQDGLRGCRALRETGAHIIAQDEATSVVWGMPGAVVQAGLADLVLPIERVAAALSQRTAGRRAA